MILAIAPFDKLNPVEPLRAWPFDKLNTVEPLNA